MDSGLILLVDDNPDDIECMRRACTQLGVTNTIHVVDDGEQAMDYLSGRGRYAQRSVHPFPTLLLLDIRMPKCGGFEFLKLVRGNQHFSQIPVILLTAYDTPDNRKQGLLLGAKAFLPKTPSSELFGNLLLNLNARILVPFHPEAIIHFTRTHPAAGPKGNDSSLPLRD